MYHQKNRIILFSLLVILAVIIAACDRPFPSSDISLSTPTLLPTNLFVISPFPSSDNPMAMVEELSTGTALAETAAALTAGTPLAATETPLPEGADTSTPTTVGSTPQITSTSTPTLASGASSTNTPGSGQGSTGQSCTGTYTLQQGEFPYCIARRCNIDPDTLLASNNLTDGDVYMPGLTLTLPTGGFFPGDRSLSPHPTTYTVSSSDDTLYSIACKYGDVDPFAIAQANNISVGSALTAGQTLSIP